MFVLSGPYSRKRAQKRRAAFLTGKTALRHYNIEFLHPHLRFLLLFRGSRSRSEVVATFLAVLELCKARVLHLAGSETDCIVRQERDDVPENLTF